MSGEAALLHDCTIVHCADEALRTITLTCREGRKSAVAYMTVTTYKCVGASWDEAAPLRPQQLANLDDDARRGACRCAPSLPVSALRARIARAVGRDVASVNLRILAPRERTLEKLSDGNRLGDYLPTAALPRGRGPLEVIVTERIVVADFDYDSDETDLSRIDPGAYADAQTPGPMQNH